MKKYISRILFCLSVLVLPLSLASQPKTITVDGQVSDENGEPLAGATVRIEDSQTGTVTDGEGRYRIKVQSDGALVFSFMGYETRILTVRGSRQLNVALEPDLNLLDEIIVVGYGTMKRSDLTGSISSVSSKTIDNYKTASVYEALGGMMAGVYVTSADGTPGAEFDIKIRGVGTVTGDSSPLYIVDGFEVDNLSSLSNQDIASVEVLKDASASAIYGSRAANGVVLVTTKSGKNGRPEIAYNGSASYRTLSRHLDVLSPYEFVKLQMELDPLKFTNMYYRLGNDEAGQPYRYQTMDDYHNVSGIDWQEEAFRPTWSQNHDLSVRGGQQGNPVCPVILPFRRGRTVHQQFICQEYCQDETQPADIQVALLQRYRNLCRHGLHRYRNGREHFEQYPDVQTGGRAPYIGLPVEVQSCRSYP